MESPSTALTLSDEWLTEHFDYLSPDLANQLHPAFSRLRQRCPVAHSDQRGGYWVVSKYEDVLRIAQDWQNFSSELGVGIPGAEMPIRALPEHVDPPIHRTYKRLINAYFTPAAVAPYEEPTREILTGLIDQFIERGSCDFMAECATPFPGLAFFGLVLNAPPEQVSAINEYATKVSVPQGGDSRQAFKSMVEWIAGFVEQRRAADPRGDVVDAILHAEIEGRPVTDDEVLGLILLLILGGLETTSGALGHIMLRFCREPEIPAALREDPARMPDAIEELLRLEGPFIGIGRTVRNETEINGFAVHPGEKVFLSWTSANRDEAEFEDSESFRLDRTTNRHLAFGAGPHRCAGSNLARLNLRIALTEIVNRLEDLTLDVAESEVHFHSAFNRSPLGLPISFTPGPRLGSV